MKYYAVLELIHDHWYEIKQIEANSRQEAIKKMWPIEGTIPSGYRVTEK